MLIWNINLYIVVLFVRAHCVPVSDQDPGKVVKQDQNDTITFWDEINQKEYSQYLTDVIQELEKDDEFQNNLEKNKDSLSTDDLANAFKFASKNARNKLDEMKRREIERLNIYELKLKQIIKRNLRLPKHERDNLARNVLTDDKSHLHLEDGSDFTENDLRKLISKVKHDLQMTDAAKERQYRRSKWRKNWKRARDLERIKDEEKRKAKMKEWSNYKNRFGNRAEVNEPGSEDQIKDVWKSVDHLDAEYFNIKTFFNIHDLNQDGQWDIEEIEALVLPNIQKNYEADGKELDSEEKYHEIMKMRQHFMEKMDKNNDKIVSYEEFENYSKANEFKHNSKWKLFETSDEMKFSEEETKLFEKEVLEIQNLFPPSNSSSAAENIKAAENPKTAENIIQ